MSVPTVIEGQWAALLAQKTVTPARYYGNYDETAFAEGKREEASDGEKLNEGEVDLNGYSKKGYGEAEVSMTALAENANSEAIGLVHDIDNRNVDDDT
ncbi:hypothetical protein MRX96_010998 [Rhipicephalus microplus]